MRVAILGEGSKWVYWNAKFCRENYFGCENMAAESVYEVLMMFILLSVQGGTQWRYGAYDHSNKCYCTVVILNFEDLEKTLTCDQSNDSNWLVLSCGTVYCAVLELLPFVYKIHKCGRRTKKNMNKTATTTTTTKPQKNRRVSENKR